jgi:Outer membrane lipoprotein carrier protein LolA-like
VRRVTNALAGALLALASLPALAQWSVDDLMTALAVRGSADATFTEQRYVPVLDAPVQSSGTLRFVAPDRLEKHTLLPRAESLVLTGDQLTLLQGPRTRRLALTDLPDNGLAINSLRGTMAGDLAALRRGWNVTLFGERRIWTLSLTPLSAAVAQYIETVLIEGQQDRIDRIEIRQADGVRSVMQIKPAAADRSAPGKSR